MEAQGLEEDSKTVEHPISSGGGEDPGGDDASGNPTAFRSQAARLNYLALDRSDIQFATKTVCGKMSTPTVGGEEQMKKATRYLVGAKRLIWEMRGDGGDEEVIEAYVDSDWAGKLADRKSTSGGALVVGGGCVKTWSRTQKSRALSSAEAEYYALVSGAAEALGLQALALDLGWRLRVRLWSDAKGARGIASRRGLGKTRHIELRYLWLQQAMKRGRLEVCKIDGKMNPVDHLTKPLSRTEMTRQISMLGGRIEMNEHVAY